MPAPTKPTVAQPLQALAGFAAFLREHGLHVGVAEQQAFVRAALALPVHGRAWQVRHISAAWRALACHNARDWPRWPDLFERYWQPQRVKGSTRVSGQTRPRPDLRQLVQQLHDDLASGKPGQAPPGRGAPDTALHDSPAADTGTDTDAAPRSQGGATRTDALHDRSLALWLPQDLAQLQALAERIAARLRRRQTRRWQADSRGRRLDLRRTLRNCLHTSGEPVAPAWRQPRRERPRLFILVDVSRSMETHAQLFLRIARAFVQAAQARAFVFHTRLAEVTPLLQRDSATVQEKVNAVTAGFGGGTRIATSVADFCQVHARRQLGRRSRVWLLSDGFDADPPDQLREQLAAVHRRGARVTWFHPGPARPPSAALHGCDGLIDRFIPLHSLRHLAQAVPLLT